MRSSNVILLISTILPFTHAYSCVDSIAQAYPANPKWGTSSGGAVGSGGSSSGTSTCSKKCGTDSSCLQTCLEIIASGQCNAAGGSTCPGGSSSSTDDLISNKGDDLISSGDDGGLIKWATVECTTSEVCYKYSDGDLLCIDPLTAQYHDSQGGKGNANTGVYTYANGQVTTNNGAATATTSRRSTRTSSASLNAATTSDVAARVSSVSSRASATSAGSASAASVTPTNAARRSEAEVFAGVVAFAVALAL